MPVLYQADGSVICTGNANPARSATYPGPRNSAAQTAAVEAFFAGDPAPVDLMSPTSLYASIQSVAASVPLAGASVPPAVGDAGSLGSDPTKFAREMHTHASKARKERKTGVNTATYTWTFPTAFGVGVVPICNAIVEDPADSGTDSYNVQISGVPTNSQVTFRIKRQSAGLLALLTGALSLNPTPGTINLHCIALEP